jgi:hypothetical protein
MATTFQSKFRYGFSILQGPFLQPIQSESIQMRNPTNILPPKFRITQVLALSILNERPKALLNNRHAIIDQSERMDR